jgi:hypothetical protein
MEMDLNLVMAGILILALALWYILGAGPRRTRIMHQQNFVHALEDTYLERGGDATNQPDLVEQIELERAKLAKMSD